MRALGRKSSASANFLRVDLARPFGIGLIITAMRVCCRLTVLWSCGPSPLRSVRRCLRLRARQSAPLRPVLALAPTTGAVAVLPKPWNVSELLSLVDVLAWKPTAAAEPPARSSEPGRVH